MLPLGGDRSQSGLLGDLSLPETPSGGGEEKDEDETTAEDG
jgi:hypothetical protein